MSTVGYYQLARPSFSQRAWRFLGFRVPHVWDGPDHDNPETPYWMKTVVVCNFGFGDRLRILFAGKAMVETEHATDVQVSKCKSVSAAGVLPPGYKR